MFNVLKQKSYKVTETRKSWLSMWVNDQGRYCIGHINDETGLRVVYDKGSKYYIEGLWNDKNYCFVPPSY